MQKHIFKGTEKIKRNYEVVFKIWAKKKSGPTIHPSHPIRPIRQYESGQKAWEPGGFSEKATYRHTSKHIFL